MRYLQTTGDMVRNGDLCVDNDLPLISYTGNHRNKKEKLNHLEEHPIFRIIPGFDYRIIIE